MKNIITTFLLVSIFSFGFSQTTTEEEYNWMTKGYQVMVTSGLDMKKGYYFDESQAYSDGSGSYSFNYKFLRREKDKSLAGVSIVAKSTVSGKTYYFGMPIGAWYPAYKLGDFDMPAGYGDSEFMNQFTAAIYTLDWPMYRALVGTLCNLFARISVTYLPKK